MTVTPHTSHILSIYRNKKICGYDFYEAHAGEDGLPRLDLNGSHSSVIFEEGIEERLSVLPNDQPLFAYMSLKAPHGPLQPKEHILNMYRDQYGLDPGKKLKNVEYGVKKQNSNNMNLINLPLGPLTLAMTHGP